MVNSRLSRLAATIGAARRTSPGRNWRPLTPYDAASIMHYPQCNGSSSDLSMTETDRAGVRSVYGS